MEMRYRDSSLEEGCAGVLVSFVFWCRCGMGMLTVLTGKRLAMQELKIIIFHLMYNFEFMPLPEELQDMSASERIFRQPNMTHVRLKKL